GGRRGELRTSCWRRGGVAVGIDLLGRNRPGEGTGEEPQALAAQATGTRANEDGAMNTQPITARPDLRDSDARLADDELRRNWSALLDSEPVIERLFATPEWCDQLVRTGAEVKVLPVFQPDGSLASLGAFRLSPFELAFTLKGKTLWKRNFRAARVLG